LKEEREKGFQTLSQPSGTVLESGARMSRDKKNVFLTLPQKGRVKQNKSGFLHLSPAFLASTNRA
jgi:hypothetical protein